MKRGKLQLEGKIIRSADFSYDKDGILALEIIFETGEIVHIEPWKAAKDLPYRLFICGADNKDSKNFWSQCLGERI